MMDRLAYRGGFVWKVSLDLRERYGELKGRDSMIWVEPPGTPTVGLMLIKAYEVTGEDRYLTYADRVATALVEGQLPCGGWHYFIDFDPDGTQAYYDTFFSRQWGWQEYLHYYNNATFDDDVTASATRFLLRLNRTPLASKYDAPLIRALDFVLRAQDAHGGWPQRFPPNGEFTQHGHPDYTSFSTFNDGVTANNIDLLLEASRQLGGTQYKKAARRGMDFYLVSQLPPPQAGWAQQYDRYLKPGWGRPFEPPAVCSPQTMENVLDLIRFARCTGDRKYLKPIPPALDWLEEAERVTPFAKPYTHTCFYALKTNRPLFVRRTGRTYVDTRFELSDDAEGAYPYAVRLRIDVGALRDRYESAAAMSAAEARAEYEKQITRRLPVVKVVSVGADTRVVARGPEEIRSLIDGLGSGDGWIVENQVLDIEDFLRKPPRVFPGYGTGTYVARMYRLIHYLEGLQQ
ncbi:MAG: pectate lyase [Pirellulales bacterium]